MSDILDNIKTLFNQGGAHAPSESGITDISSSENLSNDFLSNIEEELDISDKITEKLKSLKENLFSFKKPQNLDEYYHFCGFLLAKKIGYILLIAALLGGIWCLIAIGIPHIKLGEKLQGSDAKECYYDAPGLKRYTGKARVFSKKSDALYEGSISNGIANGLGALYDKNGSLLYRGAFTDNGFCGEGTMYFRNGQAKYTGTFLKNLFQGDGTLSFENGKVEYIGKFLDGKKNGPGTLFDETGAKIYTGMFYDDAPDLSAHLNIAVSKLQDIFLGSKVIYNSEGKIFINYPDMNCIIVADKNDTSLGNTNKIFIIPPSYYPGTNSSSNRLNLMEILNGGNFVNGFTKLTSSEMCVFDVMRSNGINRFKNYEAVSKEEILEDVFNITKASTSEEIYISKYKINNFIYTFYFETLDGPCVFYSIERLG
ncbi:MAG: hypothetical protein LBJ83_03075 [Oscillospiraceae bacterium]|nr:hypothetical protein [Oscillospiraceae bacterium]